MLVRVMRRAGIVKDARRVPEHPIAAFDATRRRLPPAGQARVEQLTIGGLVAPDGDRRHGAQSRGVIDEIASLERDEHVMRVLVLRQDGRDLERRALLPAPLQDALERRMGRHGQRQRTPRCVIEVRVIDQWCIAHEFERRARTIL